MYVRRRFEKKNNTIFVFCFNDVYNFDNDFDNFQFEFVNINYVKVSFETRDVKNSMIFVHNNVYVN